MPAAAPKLPVLLISLVFGPLSYGCSTPASEPVRDTTVYEGSVQLGSPDEAREFLLDYHEVTGDFILHGEASWDLSGLQTIGGSLLANDAEFERLDFPDLQDIGWMLLTSRNPRLESFQAPKLTEVGAQVSFSEDPALQVLNLQSLAEVASLGIDGVLLRDDAFHLERLSSLDEFSSSSLAVVHGLINLTQLPLIREVLLPNLTQAGALRVDASPSLQQLEAPQLQGLEGELRIDHIGGEHSEFLGQPDPPLHIDFSQLEHVSGDLFIDKNTSLIDARFDALRSVGGTADFLGAVVMSGLYLDSLEDVGGRHRFEEQRQATEQSLSNLQSTGGLELRFHRELTTFSAPALATIEGDLLLEELQSLSDIALPSLSWVSGDIRLHSLPSLPNSEVDELIDGLGVKGLGGQLITDGP